MDQCNTKMVGYAMFQYTLISTGTGPSEGGQGGGGGGGRRVRKGGCGDAHF